jgi:hypothetical protein
MQESDMEEILRGSIDILCDDEESMLIVGRQVKNPWYMYNANLADILSVCSSSDAISLLITCS